MVLVNRMWNLKRQIALKTMALAIFWIIPNIGFANGDLDLNSDKNLFFIKLTPQAVKGKASSESDNATVADLAAAAKKFFLDQSPDFYIRTNEELVLHKKTTDSLGRNHLRFHRFYRGIRIQGVELIAHFNSDNQLISVNGYTEKLPEEARLAIDSLLDKLVSAEDALNKIAENLMVQVDQVSVLNKTTYIDIQEPYIYWHFDIDNKLTRYSYIVSIDLPVRIISKSVNQKH